jgi:hypothetical protein
MPHTHQRDPGSKPSTVRLCPTCGSGRMRLVLTRASSHYVNLDECLYKCDCGEEAEYIVMREE